MPFKKTASGRSIDRRGRPEKEADGSTRKTETEAIATAIESAGDDDDDDGRTVAITRRAGTQESEKVSTDTGAM